MLEVLVRCSAAIDSAGPGPISSISAGRPRRLSVRSPRPNLEPRRLCEVKPPTTESSGLQPGRRYGESGLDCHIEKSLISEGCILNKVSIIDNVIGIRSRIGGTRMEALAIERRLLPRASTIWMNKHRTATGRCRNTVIRKAIIDKNVRIGNNCRITNQQGLEYHDGENYYIREGIIVIPKGATIPHGTTI
jgi:ADP-glucose pyrophosphorylase